MKATPFPRISRQRRPALLVLAALVGSSLAATSLAAEKRRLLFGRPLPNTTGESKAAETSDETRKPASTRSQRRFGSSSRLRRGASGSSKSQDPKTDTKAAESSIAKPRRFLILRPAAQTESKSRAEEPLELETPPRKSRPVKTPSNKPADASLFAKVVAEFGGGAAPTELKVGEKVMVTRENTPFYAIGPAQPLPPEEILGEGDIVTLRSAERGWCDVELSNGETGVVSTKSIRVAKLEDLVGTWAAVELPASSTARGKPRGGSGKAWQVIDWNLLPEPELPMESGAPLDAGLLPPLEPAAPVEAEQTGEVEEG